MSGRLFKNPASHITIRKDSLMNRNKLKQSTWWGLFQEVSQKGGLYRVRSLGFCETENLQCAIDIDNGTSIYQAKKETKAKGI